MDRRIKKLLEGNYEEVSPDVIEYYKVLKERGLNYKMYFGAMSSICTALFVLLILALSVGIPTINLVVGIPLIMSFIYSGYRVYRAMDDIKKNKRELKNVENNIINNLDCINESYTNDYVKNNKIDSVVEKDNIKKKVIPVNNKKIQAIENAISVLESYRDSLKKENYTLKKKK